MGRSIRLSKPDRTIPVARSEGLLVEPVGSETVIYDLETKQAHCLKPLAALVFESCDGEQSIATIAQLASERLSATVTADEVAEAVSQLESLALLDTPLIVHEGNGAMSSNGNGVSRREMLRRVGFAGAAAAVATPLVTSIVPSTAIGKSPDPWGCSGLHPEQGLRFESLLPDHRGKHASSVLRGQRQLVPHSDLSLRRAVATLGPTAPTPP